MPSIFHRYSRLVQKYPFRINALSLGLLFGVGDYVLQRLFPDAELHREPDDGDHPAFKMFKSIRFSDHNTPYNWDRTWRAVAYGTIVFSPIATFWQTRVLPNIRMPMLAAKRAFMSSNPRLKLRLHVYDTLGRLTVDQLTMPGLVFIPLYNFCMVAMAGYEHPFAVTKEKLEKNWFNVLKASWTVWGGFQLVLLMWIPVHFRVLAGNLWQVGWLAFLLFCHNTRGHGKGSGKLIEELVDIQDKELKMVYD